MNRIQAPLFRLALNVFRNVLYNKSQQIKSLQQNIKQVISLQQIYKKIESSQQSLVN